MNFGKNKTITRFLLPGTLLDATMNIVVKMLYFNINVRSGGNIEEKRELSK